MMAEKIISGPEQRLKQVSFGQLLLQGLQEGGSKIAIVDAVTGADTTYKEILQRTISLAHHLKKMGLKKDDVISISSENSLYFSIPVISAIYLGLIVAPLNQSYTERELEHALNISKPKVIFCTSDLIDKFISISKKLRFIKKIITINKCNKVPRSVLKLEDFLNLQTPEKFTITPAKPDDVIAILCSSGTTGLPKGVMLTHQGYIGSLHYLQHQGFGRYRPDRIAMGLLPFYHAYGSITHLCMIASNIKVIVLPRFEEHLFLRAIQDYKITVLNIVPPLVLFLSKSPLVDKYDLSSLKEVVSGAAPLSKEVQEAVKKRLNVKVIQGYGLTELTLAATVRPQQVSRLASVGILVPGLECKVIDVKTGKSLGPNQSGELLFRGTQIMKGYARNPAATDQTIDRDGWLHTGDIGYYDQEEYLYIVDRYKELIKYKGFQVPPAEIEGIILNLPDVIDCAIIGKPDDEAGELPYAFVVRKPNSNISEKDIYDYVAQNVSYHKRLHGGIQFVNSIPKNPTGKILRRILREQVQKPTSKL